MHYNRILNLTSLLTKKSFFLFGPRATGKSYLIREELKNKALVINLLEYNYFLRLSANPDELTNIIESSNKKIIVIDEIQKIPQLLNIVHKLIEEKKLIFLLTGSSARKLKHNSNVNLLAGRAWEANLFPLCYKEILNFDLDRYLLYGGLPAIYSSLYPDEELYAYNNTYLKEEIQAEALVRKMPSFTRFLEVAALTSGQLINYNNIASDTSTPASTIRQYYQILEDTLIGFSLPAWTKSIKRKAISTAKFYFFDLGVANNLSGITALDRKTPLFGEKFEHFIILELRAYISYRRIKTSLSFWRSKNGQEVDLLVGNNIAIEIKSTEIISTRHLAGLKALKEENIFQRYFLISCDKISRIDDNIHIIYWKDFLKLLWDDKIIN